MAAISFIDSDHEIFKAEHAFGRKYVDRSKSIGAHVLLSNEPMVILDTAEVCCITIYPIEISLNCLN